MIRIGNTIHDPTVTVVNRNKTQRQMVCTEGREGLKGSEYDEMSEGERTQLFLNLLRG